MALTNYERWKRWAATHPKARRRIALESYHRRKKIVIKTIPIPDPEPEPEPEPEEEFEDEVVVEPAKVEAEMEVLPEYITSE